MRVVLCVALLLCGAVNCGLVAGPLTTLVRAPSYDSAVIQSDRLGGNFAYSTAESHAYAAVAPIVQHVVKPVAVTYKAHQLLATPPVISTSVVHAAPVVAPAVVTFPQTIFTSVVSPAEVPAKPVAEDAPSAVANAPSVVADAPAVSDDAVEVEAA